MGLIEERNDLVEEHIRSKMILEGEAKAAREDSVRLTQRNRDW